VYAVAPNIAAGFAGSVRIGFAMVDLLRQCLRLPKPGFGWDPAFVAENFPTLARKVFCEAEPREQDAGCQILLFSVHPNKNNGDAPWAMSFVHKFESPGFEATLSGPTDVLDIGCGRDVGPYADVLREINEAPNEIDLSEGLGPGGSVSGLLLYIETVMEGTPAAGISPHLHICVVRREGISIQPNNKTVYTKTVKHFQMPRVATSFDELERMISALGSTAYGAVC